MILELRRIAYVSHRFPTLVVEQASLEHVEEHVFKQVSETHEPHKGHLVAIS